MLGLGRLKPSRALATVGGGLIAAVLYLSFQPWPIGATPAYVTPVAPSAATASFLTAYGLADEDLADALASPLYRAEWARRGLSARDRMTARGAGGDVLARSALRFEYVGGTLSAEGFGHHLFVVWPIRQGRIAAGPSSVWRVDADPQGRVIWLELVWGFGVDTRAFVKVDDSDSLAAAPVPAEAAAAGLRPIVGVVSASSPEGHYLIGPRPDGSGSSRDVPVTTYSVDPSGMLRPGAWTFGYGDWSMQPYPPRQRPSQLEVAPRDRPTLDAYLRALG